MVFSPALGKAFVHSFVRLLYFNTVSSDVVSSINNNAFTCSIAASSINSNTFIRFAIPFSQTLLIRNTLNKKDEKVCTALYFVSAGGWESCDYVSSRQGKGRLEVDQISQVASRLLLHIGGCCPFRRVMSRIPRIPRILLSVHSPLKPLAR